MLNFEKFLIVNFLYFLDILCVLDVDRAKNVLSVFSTDLQQISRFFEEIENDLSDKKFDMNLIEQQHKSKFKNLCECMETESDCVILCNQNEKIVEICGFNHKCELYYNQLINMME